MTRTDEGKSEEVGIVVEEGCTEIVAAMKHTENGEPIQQSSHGNDRKMPL